MSKGGSGDRRDVRWWNDEVKERVRAKQVAYAKLMGSNTEEEKETNGASYKIKKKEENKSVQRLRLKYPRRFIRIWIPREEKSRCLG